LSRNCLAPISLATTIRLAYIQGRGQAAAKAARPGRQAGTSPTQQEEQMIRFTGGRVMAAATAAAFLMLAGGGLASQAAQAAPLRPAASGHLSAKAAPLAGPPGYTYAGWFASFTGCDLHGTVGQYFGEWSTFECLPLTENPDDGYELWIM
jgi:hypothetical protein